MLGWVEISIAPRLSSATSPCPPTASIVSFHFAVSISRLPSDASLNIHLYAVLLIALSPYPLVARSLGYVHHNLTNWDAYGISMRCWLGSVNIATSSFTSVLKWRGYRVLMEENSPQLSSVKYLYTKAASASGVFEKKGMSVKSKIYVQNHVYYLQLRARKNLRSPRGKFGLLLQKQF